MEWNNENHPYPNGCHSAEAYNVCVKNGYIRNNCFCYHPARDCTFIINTNIACRPCHPKAMHAVDVSWSFKSDA